MFFRFRQGREEHEKKVDRLAVKSLIINALFGNSQNSVNTLQGSRFSVGNGSSDRNSDEAPLLRFVKGGRYLSKMRVHPSRRSIAFMERAQGVIDLLLHAPANHQA